MCHESSHRSAAGVLAAVPAGPPRPLGPGAALLGRVVAERLLDELVLVDGTSAPAAPQSPLLGVDSSAQMVEALLRDLGRDVRFEEVGEEQGIRDERVDAGRGATRCPRPRRRRDAVAPATVSRRGVFVEADAFAQAPPLWMFSGGALYNQHLLLDQATGDRTSITDTTSITTNSFYTVNVAPLFADPPGGMNSDLTRSRQPQHRL